MTELRARFGDFEQAIRFFRRKVNVPTARWDDLWHGQHAHGFMVAGATKVALLDDFRRAVDAAIADGETLEQFRKRFDTIVAKHGWQYNGSRGWRSRVIWETNVRTAVMAGKWEQFSSADMSRLPYLMYQHNTLLNPREHHKAWDKLVLRKDDPWWATHFPPNGWGCRCTVIQISERQLRRLGKGGPDTAPGSDPPGALPPEWAYNVGEAAQSMGPARALGDHVMQMPPAWRDVALADAQRRAPLWMAGWSALVDEVMTDKRPRGGAHPVAYLRPETIAVLGSGVALDGRKITAPPAMPTNALVAMERDRVLHTLRDAHSQGIHALDAELRQLHLRMSRPDAVYWDDGQPQTPGSRAEGPALIYAWKLADGRIAKAVVQLNWRAQTTRSLKGAGVHMGWVRTVWLVREQNLRDPRYKLLEGGL